MIIKQFSSDWVEVKNLTSIQPTLDYRILSENHLKDMRRESAPIDDKLINLEDDKVQRFRDDYTDICKKSILPLPGYVDYWDDQSSESYVPHSDWQGPTGDSWIKADKRG